MRNHRRLALLLGFFLTIALTAAAMAFCPAFWPASEPASVQAARQRVEALEQEAERARAASYKADDAYAPQVSGQLDDLSAPAAEILRQLPGVVDVEVLVTSARPAHRVIHLRDWHYVPRDLYALDLQHSAGKPRSESEVDLLHRELLLQVELVSLEHNTLLRCLVRHHGLRRVLCEGLTPDELGEFKDLIGQLRAQEDALAELQGRRAELKGKTEAIDREMLELVHGHRLLLLPYGAPGRLAIDQVAEVLPLDDGVLLQAALPFRADGTPKLDPATLEARHGGQVKAALASGPIALIVLGASHDLSASVRKLGSGDTQYIRVTTKAVERFTR